MARRATYLDKIWNQGDAVLLVEAGDVLGQRTRDGKEQSRFLASVMATFGYDAIGLGEKDLNYGLDYLRELMREHKLPYTSANVRDTLTGEPIVPEYLVVKKGGLRFGFVSVMAPHLKVVSMTPKEERFRIDEPVATLRELVPRLRREADTVILLSHLDIPGTEDLLKEVQGIDFVVVGHTHLTFADERVVGGTPLAAAGYEGRAMGRAELMIDAKGQVRAFSVELTNLDQSVADDPVMLEKVQAFKKQMEELRTSLHSGPPRTKGDEREEFLGEQSCRKCHQEIWQALQGSGHRQAFATLAQKGQSDNPDCLACHVVGYEYKNGYAPLPGRAHLQNVQCEACHGYGTLHRRDGAWAKEARATCAGCHDAANSPKFDFASYWQKIAH